MTTPVLPSFTTIQEFDLMRPKLDVELFKNAASAIAERHGLPNDPLQLFPDGSNVIFAHGKGRVIKIFPPQLKNQYESERLVLKHLQQKLSIPTPILEFEGEIQHWPYLVMSRMEGETLEAVWVDLDFENKLKLIREIGALIKEVHSLPIHGLEEIDCHWSQFIEQQMSQCVDRHRKNHLSEKILSQLPSYLSEAKIPATVTPVLLTGEYTPFNLLVQKKSGKWTLCGMIDFGDCMLGFHEYDLLGPGAFLIQGNRQLLREFLLSYGYTPKDLDPNLAHRLTALMLLHRFSNLKIQLRISDWESKVASPKDLENLAWGLAMSDK